MRRLKASLQPLTAVILAIAVLSALKLGPADTAAQPLYTVYLPWLEQSSPLNINLYSLGLPGAGILRRIVPAEGSVRPNVPAVWTNRAGFTQEFRGYWSGAPSVSWRLAVGQSFRAAFESTGIFTYTVDSLNPDGSLASRFGEGIIHVSEDPPPAIRNLWVTKKASRTVVPSGDTLEYDIFLDNVSQVDLPLVFTDTIPSQASFVDVRSGPLGGTPRPSPVYSPTLNSILWAGTVRHSRDASTGELSGYPSEWFKLTVRVDAIGPFTNTMQVSHGPITMAASAQVVAVTPTPTFTPTPTATPTPPVPTPTAVIIP